MPIDKEKALALLDEVRETIASHETFGLLIGIRHVEGISWGAEGADSTVEMIARSVIKDLPKRNRT